MKKGLNFGLTTEQQEKVQQIVEAAPLVNNVKNQKPQKTVSLSVTMWPDDVELLDQLRKENGLGRSAMLRLALHRFDKA